MLRFMGRRLTFIAIICVLIVFFSHLGMRMVQNSDRAHPNYDVIQHGILSWQDTRIFFSNALHGNLGYVTVQSARIPIQEMLASSYVNSMGLLLTALALASALGLAAGMIAAVFRGKRLALPLLTLTVLGVSTPSFFAALLLQVGELYYYRTFGRRLVLMAGFGWDLKHMLMPVLVLAARPLAYLTRAAFISLSHIMEENYIRTAFSKGLSLRETVNIHAIRNLIVPVLTAVGVSLRFSLSTLPIVEMFFVWPGLGSRLLGAINTRHASFVSALALALGLTFLLTNLLLDIVYRLIDPRLREIQ
jgi:ABC-type dipeptide/oligopeptide/nickel transport system permease component